MLPMEVVAYLFISMYTVVLLCITVYCLLQFHLLYQYQKAKQKVSKEIVAFTNDVHLPIVTIQLPVFNERYVIERLIDNIARLEYPRDKLEIQILDDSTDDTSELCLRKVQQYREEGIDIKYFHRSHRAGFKAGALNEGMQHSKGDLIAIFDADFLPNPDFLLRTVSHFLDPQVGVVQTRWGHINEDYSLITRLQAFQLNVHFTIEQSGRQAGGYLLQFNGTAGVWRRETILDAGGWHADTLTEDLDLSYRAQLKGWTIKYVQGISSPAELPSGMEGLKSQQFRWMKGGAQNAKKLIPAILSSDLPFVKKMHAATHLLSSSIFLLVLLLGILSVPALFLMSLIGLQVKWYGIFMVGMLATGSIYYVANKDTSWNGYSFYRKLFKFAYTFPVFLTLSMGLSWHNSVAVIQGYMGKKSSFVRTPKFNLQKTDGLFKPAFYSTNTFTSSTFIEGLLALYFLAAIITGLMMGLTSFIGYHLMLMAGFGGIFIYSVRQAIPR